MTDKRFLHIRRNLRMPEDGSMFLIEPHHEAVMKELKRMAADAGLLLQDTVEVTIVGHRESLDGPFIPGQQEGQDAPVIVVQWTVDTRPNTRAPASQ